MYLYTSKLIVLLCNETKKISCNERKMIGQKLFLSNSFLYSWREGWTFSLVSAAFWATLGVQRENKIITFAAVITSDDSNNFAFDWLFTAKSDCFCGWNEGGSQDEGNEKKTEDVFHGMSWDGIERIKIKFIFLKFYKKTNNPFF